MKTTFKPPFVRSALNYDTDEATRESAIEFKDPSLAQQQFKDESDINFIADRYGLTGELPQILELPAYQDFEGVFDFQTAQDAVVAAREQFMTLPAKLRTRFDNDPQKLLAFLDNPDNREDAIHYGLIKRPENAPQSPPGNAAGEGKGVTPTPGSKPAAEPAGATAPDPKT